MSERVEERRHEMRQQPKAFRDHRRVRRESEEVLDDQIEALAPEPVEGVEHRFGRSIHPSFVHVHGDELGERWTVFGPDPAAVVLHRVIGRIELQTVLGGQPASDGRLPRTAPAADPVDVPQPLASAVTRASINRRAHGHRTAATARAYAGVRP